MIKGIAIGLVILILVGAGYWIWSESRDNEQVTEITSRVSAYNQTKSADAATVSASPRDVIVYTMTVENASEDVVTGYITEVNIGDITELATLIDAQGANYNSSNNSLIWTPLDVPAKGSFEKEFTIRVKDSLPANSDAVMSTNFGNELAINISQVAAVVTPTPTPVAPNPVPTPTPTPKSTYTAPTTGVSEWLAVILALAITAGIVLFQKARKLKTNV